jgi:hypothetical protein
MDGCIKKAVEWCEGLPSRDATYVKKMELSETIGVTLKDGVWCWTSDTMLVAEVTVGVNSTSVFMNTLSLLGCTFRVKRPFSGPPIFFKKESRLLLDKSE